MAASARSSARRSTAIPTCARPAGRAIGAGAPIFPALKAGEPIHPAHLAARLTRLGVPIRAGRSSALSALAYRIPAPVLAGLSPKTTANARAQLRVDYDAYIARRTAIR